MRKVKESTREKLIDVSKELFLKNSIASVTIQDIAVKANIGEATVYRYFKKKINLVVACATSMSEEVTKDYFIFNENDTGFEAIKRFYEIYLYVYDKDINYFKFLNDFDSYIEQESKNPDDEYEDSINSYKELFLKSYNKGLNDKTIIKIDDIDTFYYSTTLALLNLCKKVAKEKSILKSDSLYDGKKVIKNLIDIILKSLKA
ncbi:MAG: TetR/AcrR family transcriptional regulator [Acholeplasmatales bacterium]|nr:TetR/AcrR family transcriptional regulator [Acholeplasmatales bacterium]